MLAAMKGSMMTEITDIGNEAHWGLILGCFKWIYAGLSPLGGYLADRTSRKKIIIVSLLVWSSVTWYTGHIHTYQALLATRALMGVSEAFYIPAALALLTDFHDDTTRSRATGFHQMGIYLGVILGGFAGYAAENPNLGWRGAFTWCGVIGLIYALPLWYFLQDPPALAKASRPGFVTTVGNLSRNRNFLLLVLYFTLPALAGWIIKDWMPEILRTQFHLGQGKAGISAVLYVQIASIVGVILGGWWADRWMRTQIRGRIFVSASGMLLFLPALFGIGHASTLTTAIGFLILFGIGWGCFDCNNMPILSQLVAPHYRATGYGMMNLLSISCGGLADWGFGMLRDAAVPLNLIFGIFAAIALLSIGVVLCIKPTEASPH
jgi:MFS family permease